MWIPLYCQMKVTQKLCVMKNFNMKVITVVLKLITHYPLLIANPIYPIFTWFPPVMKMEFVSGMATAHENLRFTPVMWGIWTGKPFTLVRAEIDSKSKSKTSTPSTAESFPP
jgi:hypothetical protein